MDITHLTEQVSVSSQLEIADITTLAEAGVKILVCNRPDDEASGQTNFAEIEFEANRLGLEAVFLPFSPGQMSLDDQQRFAQILEPAGRVHAYCRTGGRSKQLFDAAQALVKKPANNSAAEHQSGVLHDAKFDVVIIGAGSGGIATASSLRKRNKQLRIALIDPSSEHYYQPGWTMVGGGIFSAESTRRLTVDVIPNGCEWIHQAVAKFNPSDNSVTLDDGADIYYSHLVVAAGLKLDWAGIEGLEGTLGKNGVTSNYRYDLAPYTWELVDQMTHGKAIFTQPPMPIKCAGAPQKAMYLSASEWLSKGKLKDIEIKFYNSGGVLFGVDAYVPALMEYVKKYDADLCFMQTLFKVDGATKTAWFRNSNGDVSETQFEMLHVCPPQRPPDFVRDSELCDAAGWLDVDQATLQSTKHANIWGVGDVMNAPNAKTMAAARKQAPVVAANIANAIANKQKVFHYDGYGSCPLTVERGKIVLAEFTYGGALSPSFPKWLNDGTKPTSFSWFLKATLLPRIYWGAMLKGREWLAAPAAKK